MVNKTMKQIDDSDDLWSPNGASDNPLLEHSKEKKKEQAGANTIEISHEIVKPKPLRPLTRKQAAFVRHIIENPKQSATEAAQQVYMVKNRNVAKAMAGENFTKPNILNELSKYSRNAEFVITEVLEQSRKKMYEHNKEAVSWAVNARQTADSLLDRLHGKATQRTEIEQRSVSLTIDLTEVNR